MLTGNLRSAAEIKLTVAGLDDGLDLRIGGFGSDARDRFDLPAVVEQCFSAVYGRRLRASSTVIIGDAANDIACARHAGFHVIVVAHRVTREELAHHQPDAILDSLNAQQVVTAVAELTNPT